MPRHYVYLALSCVPVMLRYPGDRVHRADSGPTHAGYQHVVNLTLRHASEPKLTQKGILTMMYSEMNGPGAIRIHVSQSYNISFVKEVASDRHYI
jgi:hypothetical protein